ncbi:MULTISPECIES: hypothetical protein [unclassified Pedobacter]|uniref:hypothetical protein n=1 Tax=unclassified Pedobacter TaxID=2628915 RepID=UPI001E3C4148|nr:MULTISPECIES: hypothetical protein [unclassified Pedobacter]
MANQNISKLLQNKIELLKIEVENAQLELKKWESMADEYNAQPDKFELIATLLVGEAAENKKSRKKA